MSYLGDIKLGDTVTFKFNTTVPTTGVLTTLAGSPVLAAYLDSTTEITSGITLTQDYDSRTGMHHVAVAATAGNGYAAAKNYSIAFTAGTVGGVSLVGLEVGCFSIENRVVNLYSTPVLTGPARAFGIEDAGTSGGVTATTLTLRASSPAFGANACAGMTVTVLGVTQAYDQNRAVLSNTAGAGGVLTFDAFAVTPTGGNPTYILWGTAPISSVGVTVDPTSVRAALGLAAANLDTQIGAVQTSASNIQTRVPPALVGGRMDVNVGAVAGLSVDGTGTLLDPFGPV